jgi:hypothetical protein
MYKMQMLMFLTGDQKREGTVFSLIPPGSEKRAQCSNALTTLPY